MRAAGLSSAHEKQLLAGIAQFEAREYEVSVPLLIQPLEGAFWHLAQARGLVIQDRKAKWRLNDGSNKELTSVDALFGLEGLNLDDASRRFLRGLV